MGSNPMGEFCFGYAAISKRQYLSDDLSVSGFKVVSVDPKKRRNNQQAGEPVPVPIRMVLQHALAAGGRTGP